MQTVVALTVVPSSTRRPLAPRVQLVAPKVRLQEPDRVQKEAALIVGLLADEPASWRKFTSDYSGLVISCIRRVLCRFARITSDHDVDEIYARFCFELLANDKKKLRYYDASKGTRLTTWLGLLATNATYDYLRRLRRERHTEALPERDIFESNSPSPLELVSLAEQAQVASKILSELSERDREFVELYFAEGLSPEEISDRMGINLKTVYTKKHKITARLEAIINKAAA